jgi:hypothetical protein
VLSGTCAEKLQSFLLLYVPAVFLILLVGNIFCLDVMPGVECLVPAKLQVIQKHEPSQFVLVFPAGGAICQCQGKQQ